PSTPEEDIKVLYRRVATLNDGLSALIDPEWGAQAGILPQSHPLHPGTAAAQEQGAHVDWQAIASQREHELKTVGEQKRSVERERDGAYRERAHLIALLAAMAGGAVLVQA